MLLSKIAVISLWPFPFQLMWVLVFFLNSQLVKSSFFTSERRSLYQVNCMTNATAQ